MSLQAVYALLLKMVGRIDDAVLQGVEPSESVAESAEGTSDEPGHHSSGGWWGHDDPSAELGGMKSDFRWGLCRVWRTVRFGLPPSR
jgi:hypothetical protein